MNFDEFVERNSYFVDIHTEVFKTREITETEETNMELIGLTEQSEYFVCTLCGNRYYDKDNLIKHMKYEYNNPVQKIDLDNIEKNLQDKLKLKCVNHYHDDYYTFLKQVLKPVLNIDNKLIELIKESLKKFKRNRMYKNIYIIKNGNEYKIYFRFKWMIFELIKTVE